MSYSDLWKVVLVGDSTVGKTSLLSRFTKGHVPKAAVPTIGVDFVTHQVQLGQDRYAKAQLWDTAGQERYKALTVAHYRNATGAVLVYDITNRDSFLRASTWLEELRTGAAPNVVIALVGNKVDLAETDNNRAVQTSEAKHFASTNRLLFFETSAVTGENVPAAFDKMFQDMDRLQSESNDVTRSGRMSLGGSQRPRTENCHC
mmetsp:Transcript_11090/g.30627  ORF Transcript_11090/g.30627 Transcript_11090/m.30627 type:complete len:203 (-) Transcript_11090:140-748(-)